MTSIQVQKTGPASVKKFEQPQNGAQVTMLNQTSEEMTFLKSFEWAGSPASPGYPQTIPTNLPTRFTHISNDNFGSKAAVIYSGLSLTKQDCGWVLAWYAPANSTQSPNKVCGISGPIAVIEAMTDCQIGKALEISSEAVSFMEPVTKTYVNATIDDTIQFQATLAATFGALS